MLNLLRRKAFSKSAKCQHKVVVPGRALESRVEDNGNVFILFNVHLYGLSLPQAHSIADCLRNHARLASPDPTGYVVSVLGDFNFRYDDKPILQIPDFKAIFKEPKLPKVSKVIKGALDSFTRIEHDHFLILTRRLGILMILISFLLVRLDGPSYPFTSKLKLAPPRSILTKA